MPDSKSSKQPSKPRTASGSNTPSKPAARPPSKTSSKTSGGNSAAARPAAPRPTNKTNSATSTQLVKRAIAEPPAPPPKAPPPEPEFHPLLDPERWGRLLHFRPVWLDEMIALVLVLLGFVSLFALLNTTEATPLATFWADTIRQLFGQTGALLVSGMIVAAGVIIALPRINIHFPMPSQRVLRIEIAFFALLALLHLSFNDPEPRALAATGRGGGYVGWALSNIPAQLLGTNLTTVIYTFVIVITLGGAIGIKRSHLRAVLTGIARFFEALAERMKQPPKPRQPQRMRQVRPLKGQPDPDSVEEADSEPPAETPSPELPAPIRTTPDPVAPMVAPRPAATSNTAPPVAPVAKPTPPLRPAAPSTPSAMALSPQSLSAATRTKSKPGTKSTPTPPPPRRTRYFTVDDFQEIRQNYARQPDWPPLTLLNDTELNKPTENEINTNARIIENRLLEFDIDVEVIDVKVGPTVTQYAVQPFREVTNDQGEVVMQRVRVNKIAGLSSDLALALSAKRLRIQPYVPGHPYMGIEVPNRTPSTVALRPVMESETFARAFIKRDAETGQLRDIPLAVPLGRDVSGSAFVVDLASMPHLLIAGTTGSGKSVCITAMTMALIMNNGPDRLKLVMLDPKMVELSRFNGLPHLLGPVETDIERIIGVLRWATREMDRRYKLLETEGTRNIEAFNRAMENTGRQSEKLPFIVIIVDEIGDLMLTRPDEMERTLTRLAQMARAVGMHLMVATQRPSVDIITGLIKANFPARISFAVASGVDSRVILDNTGAETLMGRGDMLYLAPDASGPQRLQGCFVSDEEIDGVLAFWRNWRSDRSAHYPGGEPPWERALTRREAHADSDPLLEDAIDLVVREGEASASLIQRRLGIGYPRAAQLLDMLADLGVVGALKDGGRSREVLLKPGMDKYKRLVGKRR